jgi:hypothetical protein
MLKKKQSIANLQVIPATIYPCNIYVFKGFTFEEAKEDLLEICGEDYKVYINKHTFETPGHTIKTPQGSILIMLNRDNLDDMPIIAHEAFHATEFIMEYINTPLTDSTSEPYAYLLGYIVEQIIK